MFRRKQNKPDINVSDENTLEVYKPNANAPVAKVVLNGYNIEQNDSLGRHGAMCSFKIVDGNLWEEWDGQTQLLLRTHTGQEAPIKITALPVEADSYGLIEYIH
jgi:hypothetical protein